MLKEVCLTARVDSKELAAALGLGALVMVPGWDAVLSLPPSGRSWAPLVWMLIGSFGISLLVVTCRYLSHSTKFWLGIPVFLLTAFLLFEATAFIVFDVKNRLAVAAGSSYRVFRALVLGAMFVAVLGIVCQVWRAGFSWFKKTTVGVLALFAPLPVVLIVSYFLPAHSSSIVSENLNPTNRVVVALVFDELDESAIDADINNLPNFASIRARSLQAVRMYPPANYTTESLPGIITGEIFENSIFSRREIHVQRQTGGEWIELSKQGTLFQDSFVSGARTALIGWHLPYCAVVPNLSLCWDDASYRAPGDSVSLPAWILGNSRVVAAVEEQWLENKKTDVRAYSQAFFSSMGMFRLQRIGEIFSDQRHALLDALAGRRAELVFGHLACPHPPSLDPAFVLKLNMYQAYKKNLRVCDQFIGKVLRALSRDYYKNGWVLIVTSDHWFRGRDWLESGKVNSLPAGRRAVPFYVLTSRGDGAEITSHVGNNRVMRRVVREALDSEFSYGQAKIAIYETGDSVTVLRPF